MYSEMVGYESENEDFLHRTFDDRGETGFFGRVAKNRRLQRQTFSHRKEAEGIDTFRVSMLKYIEKNGTEKETGA